MRFKEIKDFPMYWIFEDGRIWSNYRGIWLKPWKSDQGYLKVELKRDKKRKSCKLHRLIAINFIPNTKDKPCVDHKDGIRTNNKLSNLRWVTYKENNFNILNCSGVSLVKDSRKKPWEAYWSVDGKKKSKFFLTEEEALQHRKLMVDKYYNRPIIT